MELLLAAAAGTRRTGAVCRFWRFTAGAEFVCICRLVPIGLLLLLTRRGALPRDLFLVSHALRAGGAEALDADFPHAVVGGAASVLFEIFWFRTADPGAAEPIGGAVAKVCCDIWFECAAMLQFSPKGAIHT